MSDPWAQYTKKKKRHFIKKEEINREVTIKEMTEGNRSAITNQRFSDDEG